MRADLSIKMAIEITSLTERDRVARFSEIIFAIPSRIALAVRSRRRAILASALCLLLLALAIGSFLVYSYRSYAVIVDARLKNGYLTSRAGYYAAPRTLRVGQKLDQESLRRILRRAGYVENEASDVWSGTFSVNGENVEITGRSKADIASPVLVSFTREGRVAQIKSNSGPLSSYTLEPEILSTDASMKIGKGSALAYRDIPPVLITAILAIEDRRFFEHGGLDFFGIVRAVLRNASDNAIGQGGSTITQQLVKNTYLSPARTFQRKFAEAMLAFTIERRLSKEDILALYCNEIYLGHRGAVAVRGVEQAARVFFGKDLSEVSLAEAATIAGMIQSPTRYAPDRQPEAAMTRRNIVLGTMVRDGFITLEDAANAAALPVTVKPFDPDETSQAPYYIDYVSRVVAARPMSENGDERSLSVYTTIDLELQELAEGAINRQLGKLDKLYKGKAKPQAALVALDPKSGDIVAMVGGRDYAETQLNRVTDARRQPGSVYKPVVYAAALESGISPLATFRDAPREFQYDRRSLYRPSNYGSAYSMRDVTLRTALVKSLNVVTVEAAMKAGLDRLGRVAESLGLRRPEPYPATALGTTEATPLEIALAYAAFANGGRRITPNVTARPDNSFQSDNLEFVEPESGFDSQTVRFDSERQVIDPAIAYMVTDALQAVIDHGTGRAARGSAGNVALAGKTGTSRDGWFVGYTPNLVCVVWIGFDDNSQLGLTGSEAALPAWVDFMQKAVEIRPDLGGERFARPAGVRTIEIDPETGLLATSYCPQRERVAIATKMLSFFECYHQSEMLFAETIDSEGIPAGKEIQTEQAPTVSRTRRRTPANPASESGSNLFDTRVETSPNGRRTLVNELSLKRR